MKTTIYYVHAWIEVFGTMPKKADFKTDPRVGGLHEITGKQLRAIRKVLSGYHEVVEGVATGTRARAAMDTSFLANCTKALRKDSELRKERKLTWHLKNGPSQPSENGWKTGRVGEPGYLHTFADMKGGKKNLYLYAKRSAKKIEVLMATISRIEMDFGVRVK